MYVRRQALGSIGKFGAAGVAAALLALLAGALAGAAPLAHADDVHTFLGAGVGAVAGMFSKARVYSES